MWLCSPAVQTAQQAGACLVACRLGFFQRWLLQLKLAAHDLTSWLEDPMTSEAVAGAVTPLCIPAQR